MAYTLEALGRRRCTGTTKAGASCRSYACWDDPMQRCANHAWALSRRGHGAVGAGC
jgi:hypothetical protein